ncbi:zinc ribbon domain-containing protein [Mucilaginibacter sp.]|uniref:zinc ribbon domain-containing protein n=1 Tax=Mucilaginibacter sp. TaxID=1882438 RepID=UPI0026036CEF|nr:zinc ribbon domain-containing protein [Mucilaginibacter sp.]
MSVNALPLRGFLICPKCGRRLSGSMSKGCRAYYHYYHCSGSCKCRFNAEKVNGVFQQTVNKFFVRDGYEPFYEEVLRKAFRLKANNGDYSRKNILQEIRELNGKIEQARDFLLSGELPALIFRRLSGIVKTGLQCWRPGFPTLLLQ